MIERAVRSGIDAASSAAWIWPGHAAGDCAAGVDGNLAPFLRFCDSHRLDLTLTSSISTELLNGLIAESVCCCRQP
jgi:hypothetical protein